MLGLEGLEDMKVQKRDKKKNDTSYFTAARRKLFCQITSRKCKELFKFLKLENWAKQFPLNGDITFLSHQVFDGLPLHIIRDVANKHAVSVCTLLLCSMFVFVWMVTVSSPAAGGLLFTILLLLWRLGFISVSKNTGENKKLQVRYWVPPPQYKMYQLCCGYFLCIIIIMKTGL